MTVVACAPISVDTFEPSSILVESRIGERRFPGHFDGVTIGFLPATFVVVRQVAGWYPDRRVL